MKKFKPGDRVLLVKPHTSGGLEYPNEARPGDEGIIQKALNTPAHVVSVDWDMPHTSGCGSRFNNSWVDEYCLEHVSLEPTEDEIRYVYKSLGVADGTETSDR